jgi:hypothetical protein
MRTDYHHYVGYGLYWLLENSILLGRPNPYSEYYSAEEKNSLARTSIQQGRRI